MTRNSIADAVESKDWQKARHLTALKVARAIDSTESSREIKALSLSLVKLIDACEKDGDEKQQKQTAKLVKFTSSAKFAKAVND